MNDLDLVLMDGDELLTKFGELSDGCWAKEMCRVWRLRPLLFKETVAYWRKFNCWFQRDQARGLRVTGLRFERVKATGIPSGIPRWRLR